MNFWQIISKLFLEGLSPQLRVLLIGLLENWESIAKKTATPFDDILIGIIKTILGL